MHCTYVHLQGISRLKVEFFVSVQLIPSAALHCTKKFSRLKACFNKYANIAIHCKSFPTFCFIFLSTTVRLLSFGVYIIVGGVGIWADILAHSKCATLNMVVSTNVITVCYKHYNYRAITQPHGLTHPFNANNQGTLDKHGSLHTSHTCYIVTNVYQFWCWNLCICNINCIAALSSEWFCFIVDLIYVYPERRKSFDVC
jgi:hypothetical protein